MLRPDRSAGGVLHEGGQAVLHERVQGARYRTAGEKAAALAQLVRPLDHLAAATPAASNQTTPRNGLVVRGASSQKKASAAVHPSTLTGGVRPASSKKVASRPSSATVAAARAPSPAPAHAAPQKAAPVIHAPDRPNAPSLMDAATRAARHVVGPVRPKSHKLVVQQYAKQHANAVPEDINEQNAQVLIERHARPLVVHPKDRRETPVVKFVPIGHVVGVRPAPLQERDASREEVARFAFVHAATPGQKPERHVHFTPPQPQQQQHQPQEEDQPLSASERAQQSFSQMQAEWKPHGLFAQVNDQHRLQHEDDGEEQYENDVAYSNAPLSATAASSLATPHINTTVPQPYSSAFQHQQHHQQQQHQQPTPRNANGAPALALSVQPPPADSAYTIEPIPSSHHESLASPSPVRNNRPQPTSQHAPQAPAAIPFLNDAPSATATATIPAIVAEEPLSPIRRRQAETAAALDAEQERRKLEADYEKSMKSYLSPSSRSTRQSLASPTHKASPTFTPNPYARAPEKDEQQRAGSSLFYEPVVTRPPDLPRMDPRLRPQGPVAASLYPTTDSDPLRSLAASLREPRLKYEPSTASAQPPDESPLSPQRPSHASLHDAPPLEGPHVWLAQEMAERAEEREVLRVQQREKWRARWTSARDRTQLAIRDITSPPPVTPRTHEQTRPRAHVAATFDALHEDSGGSNVNLRSPSLAPASSTPHRHHHHQHAPNSPRAHSRSASAPPDSAITVVRPAGGVVSGARTQDPVITSHPRIAPTLPHGAPIAQRVAFAGPAASAPSPAHMTPSPSPSPSVSSPPARRIIVGSKNQTKVNAVRDVVDQVFASLHEQSYLTQSGRSVKTSAPRRNEVLGIEVESGVSAQPLSSTETKAGAITRAHLALRADDTAEFGVGIEGGIEQIGDTWYECGWVAVVDRAGKVGTGTSARFQIADSIARELLSGVELCTIADRLSGEVDVRSKGGFMGVITNNLVQRSECYRQGVIFAFAPFISANKYW